MLLRPENVWFQDAAGAGLSNWFEVVTDVVFGSYTRHFIVHSPFVFVLIVHTVLLVLPIPILPKHMISNKHRFHIELSQCIIAFIWLSLTLVAGL